MVEGTINNIYGDKDKGQAKASAVNMSSLCRDVNILFYAVSRQAEKLDALLEKQGSSKPPLTSSSFFDMPVYSNEIGPDASRLRRDVDRLTEIIAKQGMQLDWLTAKAKPQSEREVTPRRQQGTAGPSLTAGNVLGSRSDIVAEVLSFCSSIEFLFFAGVSKVWKETWMNSGRPRRTSVHLCASSLLGRAEWLLYDHSFEQAARCHGGMACLAAQADNFKGLIAAASVHRIGLMNRGSSLRLASCVAANGSLEMMQWLRDRGCPWDESACSAASGGGHLVLLKWLRSQNCPWDSQTTMTAAKGGHLTVLKWARASGCILHRYTCGSAASAGHLEVVKWAYLLGSRLDRNVCKGAARGGHLHVVRWAREKGCPWDQSTTRAAAAAGHLSVLIWAREQGCPWDKITCAGDAIAGGHREVVEWVLAQRR